MLALEVGGRFGAEMGGGFPPPLGSQLFPSRPQGLGRVQNSPHLLPQTLAVKEGRWRTWLRAATRQAACHRWAGIMAAAAQRALAFSLLCRRWLGCWRTRATHFRWRQAGCLSTEAAGYRCGLQLRVAPDPVMQEKKNRLKKRSFFESQL